MGLAGRGKNTDMRLFLGLGPALAGLSLAAGAATSMNPVNHLAYGANVGWIDWRADGENGAVVGDYVCSGSIYGANVGWINLGNGSPANRVRYGNRSARDFGVNHDGFGNLRGYAWGANIGWINFENTGAPTVDLATGRFSGYAYSANCGWVSLSNAQALVQTDTLSPGPLDSNGLPIAWELAHFGKLGLDPAADPDNDGLSNQQEYLAGTDPLDPDDSLRLTALSISPDGISTTLTWKSTPGRFYYLLKLPDLDSSLWSDSGLRLIAPDGFSTTRTVSDRAAAQRFYRVEAVRPLAP
jgi:hypothetical protein